MKITALLTAGLLAVGSLSAIPAEAQRYGWHGQHDRGYGDYRGGRGYGYDRGHRWHGRHGYRDRHWDRGRWHRGPGWRGGYGRVVCRGGYYGQRCVRVR